MTTIAVMQPYFLPYAGYFRLMEAVDHFVIYDCVQFPRRGRVHRCDMRTPGGGSHWLTLPVKSCARSTRICDLAFTDAPETEFQTRLQRFGIDLPGVKTVSSSLADHLFGEMGGVVDFLDSELRLLAELFGQNVKFSRSSQLELAPELKAQDRILEIARVLGATRYINSPGGRGLYDADVFDAEGVELRFLLPYTGRYFNLLQDVLEFGVSAIAEDIRSTSLLDNAPRR